jgi:peptide chain release factor 1
MRPATACKSRWRHGGSFDRDLGLRKQASSGVLLLHFEGPEKLVLPLLQEAGGHRTQRVPPTEKNGSRVHTSTVTVAVLQDKGIATPVLRDSDIQERVTKGTGPGGQNRNKRLTVVVLFHTPTGIEVKAEAERTQEGNRRTAMATLKERVAAHYSGAAHTAQNQERKSQLGCGARGDKRRTYRADGVTDHVTGKCAPLAMIKAGKLELLWD